MRLASSPAAALPLLMSMALVGCSPRNALEVPTTTAGDCPDSAWPSVLEQYADYEGQSGSVGELLGDWSLLDQFGCRTDSRRFLGSVTMLDVSSVWCGPCNEAASTSMEVFEAIREVHPSTWLVTVLVQDLFAAPATVKDAEEWVESYDLEYPVVVDDAEAVRRDYGVLAFPVFLFIAPTGEIYERSEGILEDAEILDLMEYGLDEWASDLRPEGESPEGGGA